MADERADPNRVQARRSIKQQRRHMARTASAEIARAKDAPRFCPFCRREQKNGALMRHLADVHHASMSVERTTDEGIIERWPARSWPARRH